MVTELPAACVNHDREKFMKKLTTLFAAAALTVGLAACSAPGDVSKSSDDGATDGQKTSLTYSRSQGPYSELFQAAVVPILEEKG